MALSMPCWLYECLRWFIGCRGGSDSTFVGFIGSTRPLRDADLYRCLWVVNFCHNGCMGAMVFPWCFPRLYGCCVYRCGERSTGAVVVL